MGRFKDFLARKSGIYDEFRDLTKLKRDGIVPSDDVLNGVRGGIVALQYKDGGTESAAEFAKRIAGVVPSIAYSPEILHTSISTHPDCDLGVLVKAADVASRKVRGVLNNNSIGYNEWLSNQGTGLYAGVPKPLFLMIAQEVVNSAREDGVELRLPRMAHMTTNRYTQKIGPEGLKDVAKKALTDLGVKKQDIFIEDFFW